MIDRTILKQHLALERRSVTEIATALSVVAVIGATLYNLGFFAPIEWSLISVLTVQDLLTGATIAIVPMAVASWAAWIGGRLIQSASEHRRRAVAIGLPVLALSTFGFVYFFDGAGQSTLGHLACGYVATGAVAAAANIPLRWRWMPTVWLAFSLVYIPLAIGVSDSLSSSRETGEWSEVETDRGVIEGRVVRVTSAYLLVADHNAIVTIPMSKVREIRRLYVLSPEADFLARAVGGSEFAGGS